MVAKGSNGPQGTVLVAVNFNEQSKTLVETAVAICERSGLGIRLLHVLAPPPPAVWYGEITAGLKLADLAEAELEISRNEALFQLEQLAKNVPSGLDIGFSIITDNIDEGILTEAKNKNAKLLICGSAGSSYRFVPKSMSTVLSLMANAPIPVLVLNESSPHPFPQHRLKLLVLDDLSEETAHLFRGNFRFLKDVQEIAVLHVHISGLSRTSLAAALTAANVAGRNGVNLESEVGDLFTIIQDKSLTRLRDRSTYLRHSAEGGKIRYEAKVEYGNLHEVIDHLIDSFQPDILCFGKHKSFHRKPFAIGQLAYSSMLAYKLPIMVLGGDEL
jgi:nucleotide-binding universal stress UspA family protein